LLIEGFLSRNGRADPSGSRTRGLSIRTEGDHLAGSDKSQGFAAARVAFSLAFPHRVRRRRHDGAQCRRLF
jgi:hypothetical protein